MKMVILVNQIQRLYAKNIYATKSQNLIPYLVLQMTKFMKNDNLSKPKTEIINKYLDWVPNSLRVGELVQVGRPFLSRTSKLERKMKHAFDNHLVNIC